MPESSLRVVIHNALKEALKERNQLAATTLRLIIAALKDQDIAARGTGNPEGISEDAILQILQKMVKQRHESIAIYEQAGRNELADQEKAEIRVIEQFLPKPLSDAEMEQIIQKTITDLGAQNIKDMGRVMAAIRTSYAGQMDFGKASEIIKNKLNV